MSHTVLVELCCVVGAGPEYLKTILPMLKDTRAFEGCESVEAYTDEDQPDMVFLWEKWASRELQEAYLAWRIETGTLAEMDRFMASDPRFIQLSQHD